MIAGIAARAAAASPVWAAAALPAAEVDERAPFGVLAGEPLVLGVETIYEAFLVHHARARAFRPADRERAILLGDYLYAAGLVEVCRAGDVEAVAALADLVAVAAGLRADEAVDRGDEALLWAATARHLAGPRGDALGRARDALRDGDPEPLRALAADRDAVAVALHAELAA